MARPVYQNMRVIYLNLLIILHQIIYALKLRWLETVILMTFEGAANNHLPEPPN